MRNHGHLYSGFVIMTVGVLLLLGNLGVISWSILGGFSQIWPLIIVAVGLNMLFNNHVVIRMLTFTGLVVALVVAGSVYPSGRWDIAFDFGPMNHRSIDSEVTTKSFDSDPRVKSAEMKIKLAAGSLDITGQDKTLLDADFPGSVERLTESKADGGTRAVYAFNSGALRIGKNTNEDMYSHRFGLNSTIPWDVSVEAGATEARLDFSDMILRNLELNSGAGDIDIIIGKVDRKATIAADVKATDFKVVIPKGVGFRADIRGIVHDVSIGGEKYSQSGSVYVSDNYMTASEKVDINLDVAVGDINIVVK